ncbi:MAG: hypothetical protein ABIN18_02015 [Pseudomonadota bacterium]
MSSFARKSEEIFVTTLSTPDSRKAIMEDATVKIAINDLSHIGPEKAILLCKALIPAAAGLQRLKVVLNALIILRVMWFTWLINGRRVGHGPFFLKQDEDMPDSLYCKFN